MRSQLVLHLWQLLLPLSHALDLFILVVDLLILHIEYLIPLLFMICGSVLKLATFRHVLNTTSLSSDSNLLLEIGWLSRGVVLLMLLLLFEQSVALLGFIPG